MEVHDLIEENKDALVSERDLAITNGKASGLPTWRTIQARLASSLTQWYLAAAIFAFCAASTFISYQPYLFQWDDSEYLARAIWVSRAFWSGNAHGVIAGMVSIRPPVMTLLGVPWGALSSWNAAGNCFITLAALTGLLAAACLYLLLRIGVKPFFLAAASVCVAASIGPFPPGAPSHVFATGFLADTLFAWTCLAAVLLIPLESRTFSPMIRSAVLRGVLWAAILSLGAMTKLNFLYFVAFIVPTLFFVRFQQTGLRSALTALAAFVCGSSPAVFYLLRWGRPAFDNMKAASFGGDSKFYYTPLFQFLGDTVRQSPGFGLSFLLTGGALAYVAFRVIKRRHVDVWPDLLAFLIVAGFGMIVLAATNRQPRYAFPAIVGLPFLTAILISGKRHATPRRSAALAAGLVFCGLLVAAVPMRHRIDRQSFSRSEAVLALAAQYHAKTVLLATDSPTLSAQLMVVTRELSQSGVLESGTLAYQAMSGRPIEEDLNMLSSVDEVVFQDRRALSPPFTNQRVPEYEQYVRQIAFGPIRVGDDTSVYLMH